MLFADAFSDSQKEDFARRNIDLGVALLVRIPDFAVNYEKYVIYIANDSLEAENCGLVVINSEINEHVNRSAYLISQHVMIDAARHEFLTHDSFVDCTQIHAHKIENIIAFIKDNPDHLCGNVHPDVLLSVFERLSASKVLSARDKQRYSLA
ncbi:hypothetical protein ASU31_00545 [Pedobacter ginsenosidimutans]|uniref:Uncharacterized protein n=1 Tax=Pedobacter ginsenosidimutans TaxID=687842 RepID=A0A0T5VVC7_9SPHI|nr:hypothetical protein [Pedobacter ginsenosidimutans]KRT17820.1 hypothetical protein ASU31_00545 [Pedobacter ginsenosidimutans]